jgi:hypothetical protein
MPGVTVDQLVGDRTATPCRPPYIHIVALATDTTPTREHNGNYDAAPSGKDHSHGREEHHPHQPRYQCD